MVNKGTGIQQKTDHLPNSSSFMVCTGGGCWFTLALISALAARVCGVLQSPGTASFSQRLGTKVFSSSLQLHKWMMASKFSRRSIKWGYQNAVRFDLVVSKTCMTFQPVFGFLVDFLSCCTKHMYFVI